MLDIIGIGSLNLDLTVSAEKTNALPPEKVREAKLRLNLGANRVIGNQDIEAFISLLGVDAFRANLGGSTFNVIHAIAALNSDIKTGYVGVAGYTGECGLDFKKLMQELAIDDRYVDAMGNQSSGRCICFNHDGTRSFLFYPGGNSSMAEYLESRYQEILSYLANVRILHITAFNDERTPVVLERIVRDVKKINPALIISFDPGQPWIVKLTPAVIGILKLADFLFVNRREYDLLREEASKPLNAANAAGIYVRYGLTKTITVVKEEAEIMLYSRNNQQIVEQRFNNLVVSDEQISDFTGAGDLFAAGFLTAIILNGDDLPAAVDLGMRFMRTKLTTEPEILFAELRRTFLEFRKNQIKK